MGSRGPLLIRDVFIILDRLFPAQYAAEDQIIIGHWCRFQASLASLIL